MRHVVRSYPGCLASFHHEEEVSPSEIVVGAPSAEALAARERALVDRHRDDAEVARTRYNAMQCRPCLAMPCNVARACRPPPRRRRSRTYYNAMQSHV